MTIFNPPRPTVNRDMIYDAALEVANKLEADVSCIVEAYSHPMDGYELAKELEKWHYWDVKREDLDTLDEVSYYVERMLREAQIAWVETHNIQPPYPIGSRVMCQARRATGVIDGICDHSPAAYLIKADGHDDETNGYNRWVCKFENVEPAAEDAA